MYCVSRSSPHANCPASISQCAMERWIHRFDARTTVGDVGELCVVPVVSGSAVAVIQRGGVCVVEGATGACVSRQSLRACAVLGDEYAVGAPEDDTTAVCVMSLPSLREIRRFGCAEGCTPRAFACGGDGAHVGIITEEGDFHVQRLADGGVVWSVRYGRTVAGRTLAAFDDERDTVQWRERVWFRSAAFLGGGIREVALITETGFACVLLRAGSEHPTVQRDRSECSLVVPAGDDKALLVNAHGGAYTLRPGTRAIRWSSAMVRTLSTSANGNVVAATVHEPSPRVLVNGRCDVALRGDDYAPVAGVSIDGQHVAVVYSDGAVECHSAFLWCAHNELVTARRAETAMEELAWQMFPAGGKDVEWSLPVVVMRAFICEHARVIDYLARLQQ